MAALVTTAVAAFPAAAGAQEQIAPPQGQTTPRVVPIVSHYDGVTVWSTIAPDNSYVLTAHFNGQQAVLPVAPRSAPFDVDLGPDEDGNVVAVYSRCAQEPTPPEPPVFAVPIFSLPYPAWTTGRGCDIYRYDFDAQRESKIVGASTDQASEMLPSIWDDQVAFARVYERRDGNRGVYPYLYVRPLDGGRSERQPGGTRGTKGLPGPTRLDLYGRRLSFVWNYATATRPARGRTELRLDTVGGAHRVLGSASFNFASGIYATYLSPTGSRGRIHYGFQRLTTGIATYERSLTDLLLRYRLSSGERSLASPGRLTPPIWSLATDGDVTIAGRGSSYYMNSGSIQRFDNLDYR